MTELNNFLEKWLDLAKSFYDQKGVERSRKQTFNDFVKAYSKLPLRCPPLENSNVLDAGCGPGFLNQSLSGRPHSFISCDLSFNSLQAAKEKNPGGFFVQADMANMPFNADAFDLIFAISSVEFCYDRYRVLCEIARCLKPDGHLYIEVRNHDFVLFNLPKPLFQLFVKIKLIVPYAADGFKDLSYGEWKSLLRRAGFKIEKEYPALRPWNHGTFPVRLKNLLIHALKQTVPVSKQYMNAFLCRKLPPAAEKVKKVFIFISAEPVFMPVFMRALLESLEGYQVGVVIVKAAPRKKSIFTHALRFMKIFGLREFIAKSWNWFFRIVVDAVLPLTGQPKRYNVSDIAKNAGAEVLMTSNINDPDFLQCLREHHPDVFVSCGCPALFNADLINLPKFMSVNVHGSLLPKYRGLFPVFWAMLNGEKKTGITIHKMVEKADAGPILLQQEFAIHPENSMRDIVWKIRMDSIGLILKTLRGIEEDSLREMPNVVDERSFYSFPQVEDMQLFKKSGLKLR